MNLSHKTWSTLLKNHISYQTLKINRKCVVFRGNCKKRLFLHFMQTHAVGFAGVMNNRHNEFNKVFLFNLGKVTVTI